MMQALFALAMLDPLSPLQDGFHVDEIMVESLLSISAMVLAQFRWSSAMKPSPEPFAQSGVSKSKAPFECVLQEMRTPIFPPVRLKFLLMK
jgi:hypothetical protein